MGFRFHGNNISKRPLLKIIQRNFICGKHLGQQPRPFSAAPFALCSLESSVVGKAMMEMFIIHFKKWDRSKTDGFRWIVMTLIFAIATASIICYRPTLSSAAEPYRSAFVVQPDDVLQDLGNHVVPHRVQRRTWNLGFKIRYRYGSHLGEDRAVGRNKRAITSEVNPNFNGGPHGDILLPHTNKGLRHLFAAETNRAKAKPARHEFESQNNTPVASLSVEEVFRVYLVRRGDSLWKIAKQFGMKHHTLAKINELGTNEILEVGRPLKVKPLSSQAWTINLTSRSMAEDLSILNHIRMTDGRPVPTWMIREFSTEVVEKHSSTNGNKIGGDHRKSRTMVVNFQLEKNHLEAQAKKFLSIVLVHAERYNLDPALILAMIHTESSFNPHSRSKSSAYGLMQLVPHTAGKEAYSRIYGQSRNLTPEYLYDPENNIELGAAYFSILKDGYMGSIVDPMSRTYCAVAAYNAGPSNVGMAFIPEPSIQRATPLINRLTPTDVYKRLVEALPAIESRNYLRKVMTRVKKYRRWYSKNTGVKAQADVVHVNL